MIVSGGARGVDTYAVELAKQRGIPARIEAPTSYYSGKWESGLMNGFELCRFYEGTKKIFEANETLQRTFSKTVLDSGLLQRNYHIVAASEVVVALGHWENENTAEKTILQGGTGWTVQMAIDAKKPVFVYIDKDERWYHYNYIRQQFCESVYPILDKSKGIGIVGSRNATDNMKLQLRKIFHHMI